MSKTGKWITAIVSTLLSLLVLLVLALWLLNWNMFRPMINEQVSKALHRPFAINGNLDVSWHRAREKEGWRSWLPQAQITAEDIHVGNPEWAEGDTFASLKQLSVHLMPFPLIWQTVEVPYIGVTAPMADLQRLKDGRYNWDFSDGSKKEEEQAPSSWKLDIGYINFDAGQVKWKDAITDSRFEVDITSLGKGISYADIVGGERDGQDRSEEAQAYAFGLEAKGQYRGAPLQGTGKIGGLLALHDSRVAFPLEADVRSGATRVRLAGTLSDVANLGAFELKLDLSGNSLSDLHRLAGVILPDSPPYRTSGLLQAQLREPAGMTFHYRDFTGVIGKSDINGNLTFVNSKPRSKLTGELVSKQLLFTDLAPLIGADSNAQQAARGGAAAQPAGKALPVEAFDTASWSQMDADVKFTGQRIVHSEELPITDLSTHVVLSNGVLNLDPLRFGVAGGNLDTRIHLDGSRTPMKGGVYLKARHFQLRKLFPTVELMQKSLGELNGDAQLSGTGNSVAALLATSNGHMQMVVSDGVVSRALMEIAGLNVGNYVVDQLFGDEEVQINCALTNMDFKNGLMTTQVGLIDTENALIKIDGTANFKTEALDFDIRPESKGVRIFSLRSPLYVKGTMANPKPGVYVGPLALRGAGMVALGVAITPLAGLAALIAPGGDQPSHCQALLQQLKE